MDASLFGMISMICFGCAFICFIVAVYLFIKFDILNIYGEITGKSIVRGISEIRQRNQTGQNHRVQNIYEQPQKTSRIIRGWTRKIVNAHPSKALNKGLEETEVLVKSDVLQSDETEVLQMKTTLLADETVVLEEGTRLLDMTENLNQKGDDKDIHFKVEQEVKVIHSDHFIEEGGLKNE